MRTCAPPVGRGWEYLDRRRRLGLGRRAGPASRSCWPRRRRRRPSSPGAYDLVIDPSNLWLTIHESIGHATELDRALGYEAAYAGTSFATFDKLGTLRYGSPVMNVTGDRTAPSTGWPRSATTTRASQAQSWDIVKDGILVGYQLDRRMARLQGPRPVQRLRVRRLARPRPGAADGQRVAAAGPGRPVDRRS